MAVLEPSARVSVSTLAKWIKKKTEPVYRRRRVMAGLREKGRITFNHSGKSLNWLVRFREIEVHENTGMQPLTRQRTSLKKEASLPWRSLRSGESISKDERLMQKGPEAIQRVADDIVRVITESISNKLADHIYNDGNAAGVYSKRIHGFESWNGGTGSVVTNGTVEAPSDTYAGLSTVLGTYMSGSWTPVTGKGWPTGTGDPQYCAWSPLIVDVTNSGWSPTTKTWVNTWRECLRYALTYMEKLQNRRPDVFLLESEAYRQALDSLEANENIVVRRGAADSTMTKLGFENTSFEGIDLVYEYGIPTTSGSKTLYGYAFPWDALELCSMQSQLFMPERDEDFTIQTEDLAVDFWGQLRIETPAWFASFKAIS